MRILFLAIMITLLPLRGWVGDAMAMELGSHAMAAAQAETAQAAVDDCHGHASTPVMDHTAAEHGEAHAQDCGSCSACQICHSVALTPVLPSFTTAALPAVPPASLTRQPASAERAPGFKPPIS